MESDISKVANSVSVKSARKQKTEDKQDFDIMIFQNEEDYLCYVEAVLVLYKLG